MKKGIYLILVFLFAFENVSSMTQLVCRVAPGIGTLNDSIAKYGHNDSMNKVERIYQLKAGEWYQITSHIENDGFPLQIIGEIPAPGVMPATLQTNLDATGSLPLDFMFNAVSDLTIKNIYIVNADLSGIVAQQCIFLGAPKVRLVIDNCVIHPAGVQSFIRDLGGETKTFFTNNQLIDFGSTTGVNDGHVFVYGGDTNTITGLDSILVENNTFVSIGMDFFYGSYAKATHNYVNFNHNSMIMFKSQINWAVFKNEEYWTNNLMFDVNVSPYLTNWQPMPGADPKLPKPNLMYAAPFPGEVMPSPRRNIIQYNSFYRAPGFREFLTDFNTWGAANKKVPGYLYDLTWSKDSVNCREAQMFNSTNFPNFKYGNTLFQNVDPQFEDANIYNHETNFLAWTKSANYVHAYGRTDQGLPSSWAQWWWIPSNDIGYNSVWPVFNGKYSNPQYLTASIEGLPLGDLNWFPDQKAIWQQHKSVIEAHIKSGNTNRISITGLNKTHTNEYSVYPNPAKSEVSIKGLSSANITLFNLDGSMLLNAKNTNKLNISNIPDGVYLIKIICSDIVSTQKLYIER